MLTTCPAEHGVLTLQRIRLESPRIAKIIDLANDVPLESLMYSSVNRGTGSWGPFRSCSATEVDDGVVSRLLVTLSRLRRLHDALDMKVPDDLDEAYRLIGALSHEISNAQCHRREIDQLRDIQERLFNGRVTIANGLRFLVRYGVLEKVRRNRLYRLALHGSDAFYPGGQDALPVPACLTQEVPVRSVQRPPSVRDTHDIVSAVADQADSADERDAPRSSVANAIPHRFADEVARGRRARPTPCKEMDRSVWGIRSVVDPR